MQTGIKKLAHVAATTIVFATALTLPIVAQAAHRMHHHHHHHWHHAYRTLTVSPAVVAAPDPFHGPAVIFTAPIALAAGFVSLPFRAAGELFPATGNPGANPLVIVGAPVHFAGQVVQAPFYAVGTAFGAAPAMY